MKPKEMQVCWAAAKFYKGDIDGIMGRLSAKAVADIETLKKYTLKPDSRGVIDMDRRQIASAQYCLEMLGHEPGEIDGYTGHNTREAFMDLLRQLSHGETRVVERQPEREYAELSGDIPKQSEVGKYYGNPETQVPGRLTRIELPFYLRLDWDLTTHVTKVTVHKKAAVSLRKALIEVFDEYGEQEFRRLGLDRFAGSYNKRRMRGGSKWSMHAYGCAVDFYAAPNGLKTRCPHALFCKREYKAFLDIMEANEWLPAIRLWGADAMHFQRARMG